MLSARTGSSPEPALPRRLGSFLAAQPSGNRRAVEGRIAGEFRYAPYVADAPLEEPSGRGDPRASRLAQRLASNRDGEVPAERGALWLLAGAPANAVATLERALASRETAALRTDLAAAYLAKARTGGGLQDEVRALAQAARAVALAPAMPAPRFNLALALEHVMLMPAAVRAWREYLARDSASGWADEARSHLKLLEGRSEQGAWREERALLLRTALSPDPALTRRVAGEFPQGARLLVEERLLPAWGRLRRQGRLPQAAPILDLGRRIGVELALISGDRMSVDSVLAIDAALAAEDGERTAALAAGHAAYGEGLAHFRANRIDQAETSFLAAGRALRRGGSPFAGWADLYLALCDYQHGRILSLAARLEADQPLGNYPVLRARALWMRGLARVIQGRLAEALPAYSSALQLFSAAKQAENTAWLQLLIAEDMRYLGDSTRFWAHLQGALRAIGNLEDQRRRQGVLEEAAMGALWIDEPLAALYFQDQVVCELVSSSDEPAVVQALRRRAEVQLRLGAPAGARRDVQDALRRVQRISDPALRRLVEGDLLVEYGKLMRRIDPARAIGFLTAALGEYRATEFPLLTPALLRERALAYRDQGSKPLAGLDLRRALDEAERQRALLDEDSLRTSFLGEVQDLFDSMIALKVDRGDAAAAFDFAEREHARSLLDLVATGGGHLSAAVAPLVQASEIVRQLPARTALVEFAVNEDRLFIFVATRRGVQVLRAPARWSAIEEQVDRFRKSLDGTAAESGFDAAAEGLYSVLLAPAAPALAGTESLVVVPDKALSGVPFSALRDPRSGLYLCQTHAVSMAPSANLFLRSIARDRLLARRPVPRILVVGNPAIDRRLLPWLSPLPWAELEAKRVASIEPRADLLTGDAATRENFLELAGEYETVHFAGHAVINRDLPLYSGLVLAPGRTGSDPGILYARDLYRAHFANTRLVVLSACSTAEGKVWGGEGIANLVRPFLAAGVPAVIASFWGIDDRGTAELLAEFYRFRRAGCDSGNALRAARRALIGSSDVELRSPRTWASFELIGGAAVSSAGPCTVEERP